MSEKYKIHESDKDTDMMHPDDELVVFKLYDMMHPIAGRLRRFEEGRFEKSEYCYVHRGDGTILHKYSFGFEVLQSIELVKSE